MQAGNCHTSLKAFAQDGRTSRETLKINKRLRLLKLKSTILQNPAHNLLGSLSYVPLRLPEQFKLYAPCFPFASCLFFAC